MNLREAAGTAVTILLVGAILTVVLTQIFGFPTPISYVETDSMAPTLQPGDGFIGVPAPLAGEISEGDVVTFQAQTIGGGGLTTHRVVDITEDGYITSGDNNPFTDQSAGEPTVTEPQIELVAVQFNDQLVVIPGVGVAVETAQGILGGIAGLFGLGQTGGANTGILVGLLGLIIVTLTMAYDRITGNNTRLPTRSTSREGTVDSKLILLAILIALSLPILSMMAIPSGTDEAVIISTAAPSDDPTRIVAGGESDIDVEIENSQFIPKVVIMTPQSEGVEFDESVHTVSHSQTENTTLTITAPEETGPHTALRSEHHYIHVLPASVIAALHSIHPAVAMLAVSMVILSPVAILFYLLVGFRPITLREATRNV